MKLQCKYNYPAYNIRIQISPTLNQPYNIIVNYIVNRTATQTTLQCKWQNNWKETTSVYNHNDKAVR